jgi:hypothetical protein
MGSFHQYYTGADSSYFPEPHHRGKSGLRDLARFIAIGAIVSMVITAAVMRLLWHSPDANLTLEAPAIRHTVPAVYLAFGIQEPTVTHGGRSHHQSARNEGDSTAAQSGQLLPLDPKTQRIILDSPLLLPPFPTEHNIQAGTPRARLVRAFGKPDLSLRTVQQERLIETYVYEQPDRATLVVIQDGRVVSAHSAQPQRARVLPSEPDPDF